MCIRRVQNKQPKASSAVSNQNPGPLLSASPIRLFVDAHCFDQEHQGSRRFILGLYQELSQYNDLEIFMAAHDTRQLQKLFPPGRVHLIPYLSPSKYFRLTYDIPRLIKKYKVHIAHFQYISPFIKNCKQIVTIHDLLFKEFPEEFPFPYRLIKNFLFQRSAKKADIITTVSENSRASIHKFYGTQKIALIPNAVNTSAFQSKNRKDAAEKISRRYGIDQFILCVSRIEPRKNQVTLLQVFTDLELYKKGFHLVLAGHHSLRAKSLEASLKKLPADASAHVHLLKSLTETELLDFYQAAEVFVYPSKAEGFGLPPLEAAAMSVPVICSNAAAMKDFDFFGKNLICPDDKTALAERLAALLSSRPPTNELDAIAHTISQRYSWKDSASRFHRLLHEQIKISSQ